jgi:hypothetical protein
MPVTRPHEYSGLDYSGTGEPWAVITPVNIWGLWRVTHGVGGLTMGCKRAWGENRARRKAFRWFEHVKAENERQARAYTLTPGEAS